MKYCYTKKNNNGYTLVELIVVITVLLILVSLSLKGLTGAKDNMALNREAHQLEATLKNCQSKAMYTGNYYKIEFQPTLNRYKVFNKSDLESIKYLENIELHYTNFKNNKVYFLCYSTCIIIKPQIFDFCFIRLCTVFMVIGTFLGTRLSFFQYLCWTRGNRESG